jgi:hypothetical protein
VLRLLSVPANEKEDVMRNVANDWSVAELGGLGGKTMVVI